MITYHRGDERPAWEATITVNGAAEDLSTGHTFRVTVATDGTATPELTKTTNITGAAGGVVTVAWASGDLDLDPGLYVAQLKITRTSDGAEWTISEDVEIKPRL